jgi:hypothetical protein
MIITRGSIEQYQKFISDEETEFYFIVSPVSYGSHTWEIVDLASTAKIARETLIHHDDAKVVTKTTVLCAKLTNLYK